MRFGSERFKIGGVCDGIWVRKVQIWGFCDGFGLEKSKSGISVMDLGQESLNLDLCGGIWVRKV